MFPSTSKFMSKQSLVSKCWAPKDWGAQLHWITKVCASAILPALNLMSQPLQLGWTFTQEIHLCGPFNLCAFLTLLSFTLQPPTHPTGAPRTPLLPFVLDIFPRLRAPLGTKACRLLQLSSRQGRLCTEVTRGSWAGSVCAGSEQARLTLAGRRLCAVSERATLQGASKRWASMSWPGRELFWRRPDWLVTPTISVIMFVLIALQMKIKTNANQIDET